MIVREFVDGAIADHGAVFVAEGAVAHLSDRQTEHVVGEDPVDGLHGAPAPKLPLAQRRLVPNANPLPHGPVLGSRVAKVIGPEPALPLHELAAGPALEAVECCPNG